MCVLLTPATRALRPACLAVQGIDFDDKGLVLVSDLIRKGLGIDVAVLMGANVAKEVRQPFCWLR